MTYFGMVTTRPSEEYTLPALEVLFPVYRVVDKRSVLPN